MKGIFSDLICFFKGHNFEVTKIRDIEEKPYPKNLYYSDQLMAVVNDKHEIVTQDYKLVQRFKGEIDYIFRYNKNAKEFNKNNKPYLECRRCGFVERNSNV